MHLYFICSFSLCYIVALFFFHILSFPIIKPINQTFIFFSFQQKVHKGIPVTKKNLYFPLSNKSFFPPLQILSSLPTIPPLRAFQSIFIFLHLIIFTLFFQLLWEPFWSTERWPCRTLGIKPKACANQSMSPLKQQFSFSCNIFNFKS